MISIRGCGQGLSHVQVGDFVDMSVPLFISGQPITDP